MLRRRWRELLDSRAPVRPTAKARQHMKRPFSWTDVVRRVEQRDEGYEVAQSNMAMAKLKGLGMQYQMLNSVMPAPSLGGQGAEVSSMPTPSRLLHASHVVAEAARRLAATLPTQESALSIAGLPGFLGPKSVECSRQKTGRRDPSPVISPAHRDLLPEVSVVEGLDAALMTRARDAAAAAISGIVQRRLADRSKVTALTSMWETYQGLLGSGCTLGLGELCQHLLTADSPRIVVGGKATRPMMTRRPQLEDDLAACVTVRVEKDDVHIAANRRFEEAFMSANDLKGLMRDHKLICLFAWTRVMAEADLPKLYETLLGCMLSVNEHDAFMIGKCSSPAKDKNVDCILNARAHIGTPGDKEEGSLSYTLRIWPLVSRPLDLEPRSKAAETTRVASLRE